jgi:hypothetical protein
MEKYNPAMKSWEEQIELPAKGPELEYAYILKSGSEPVECSKEKLDEILESDENVVYVTTPQHSTFIIPGSDFETLQPILRKNKKSIEDSLYMGLLYTVIFGGLMLLVSLSSDKGFWSHRAEKINLLVFGIIPVLNALYELFSIRRVNGSNYQNESSEIKFKFWINQENIYSIYIFTGVLIAIACIQFFVGLSDSIELAGLVKSKTVEGEYWRLLTCTLMHGSIMHIIINSWSIYVIGHLIIRITGLSYFLLVFLFSGLLGSLFSIFLLPTETSVGASGGIMGLIGFILIMSLKFKEHVPRNMIKLIGKY